LSLRWGRRVLLVGLIVLATAAGLALVPPPHGSSPDPVHAEAALVLSGDVDFLRMRRAAALYNNGGVQWIVLTGAGIGGDDARVMRLLALRLGIPDAALLLEISSRSTWENLTGAAPLIRTRGWRRVALITSASHMGRAERVAAKVMPEVSWISVPVPDAGPPRRVYHERASEWIKLAGYLLRGRAVLWPPPTGTSTADGAGVH
jgi:uncharacterized SAM-binding protein YcdF (DUF218 family)